MGLTHSQRALALLFTGVILAGCESTGASVTPDDPGYKALLSGDYTTSQNEFQPKQAKNPHDPYLELDLGVAYQQLGRMDLAEALYRQAMVDGKDVYPPNTTFERDKGKSIAEIACENISIYRKSPGCDAVVMQPPPAPPSPKTFIVFFDFNRATVTADGAAVVAEAVKAAKATGATKIQVTGYTDTVGSDSYNMKLSVKRADAIRSVLVGDGLTGANVEVDGRGFHDLLVQTGPGVREPQNRRAVITLSGPTTVSMR